VKRFALKSIFAIAATAFVLFAAAVPSFAAGIAARATAEVPFAFELGGASMPAGKYVFETRPINSLLVVTDPTGRNRALLTFPAGNPNGASEARLVFEKQGTHYRLTQVWASSGGLGAVLPKDKKADQRAQLRREPVETIVLALRRK
jgi:hypothetical protein